MVSREAAAIAGPLPGMPSWVRCPLVRVRPSRAVPLGACSEPARRGRRGAGRGYEGLFGHGQLHDVRFCSARRGFTLRLRRRFRRLSRCRFAGPGGRGCSGRFGSRSSRAARAAFRARVPSAFRLVGGTSVLARVRRSCPSPGAWRRAPRATATRARGRAGRSRRAGARRAVWRTATPFRCATVRRTRAAAAHRSAGAARPESRRTAAAQTASTGRMRAQAGPRRCLARANLPCPSRAGDSLKRGE